MALATNLLSIRQRKLPDGPADARLPKAHFKSVTAKAEIGGLEVVEHLAARWERLCKETNSLPFQRPEWIAAYLKAFEPEGQAILMTASAGDRLVAVLPLVRKRGWFAGIPVWKLVGAANIHSTQFDIVRTSCAAGEAARPAFWNLLKRNPRLEHAGAAAALKARRGFKAHQAGQQRGLPHDELTLRRLPGFIHEAGREGTTYLAS